MRPTPSSSSRTAVREAAGLGQQEGMFRCSKCRGKNTDFYQKQTRSADGEGRGRTGDRETVCYGVSGGQSLAQATGTASA